MALPVNMNKWRLSYNKKLKELILCIISEQSYSPRRYDCSINMSEAKLLGENVIYASGHKNK